MSLLRLLKMHSSPPTPAALQISPTDVSWSVYSSASSNGSKLETPRCSSTVENKLWAFIKWKPMQPCKRNKVLLCIMTLMNPTNPT